MEKNDEIMLDSKECSFIQGSEGRDNLSETDTKKYYSILPDLITGWRPKNFRIAAPIFITYQSILSDAVVKHYKNFLNKLIYLGYRYPNSYKFHSSFEHEYNIKYEVKCDEMPKGLQQGLQQFATKCFQQNRNFKGMNPKLTSQLEFDSNFQSGNLDIVVKVAQNEYNLFLRPDTNTQGHMQWFYFKIKNGKSKIKTVKLNICNNKKGRTLFSRGMKPYIFSKYRESQSGDGWQQGGTNIKYEKFDIKQSFAYYSVLRNQTFSSYQLSEGHYTLSFQYTFQSSNDTVSFAYCPPFTYSEMKNHIQSLKRKSEVNILQENLCTSLSGLQIPLLTITDPSVNDSTKKCVFAMARIHPGESNGSYVMKGFLNYLISEEAEDIRKKVIFKIIPMINPDGVVFGNYRTGLAGKDLNRRFKSKNIDLFPEIINLRNYIQKLKRELPCKILYFLDFHGHSLKKNVFLYGPEYDIWTNKYERSKILPKILRQKTQMFRYQSCLFRVAQTKKTTARAYMLGLIPYCYTIQSSVGIYRLGRQNRFDIYFVQSKWENMGRHVGQSITQCVYKINESSLDLRLSKKKKNIKKQNKIKLSIEEGKENKKPKSTEMIRCRSSQSVGSKKYLNSIKNFKKSPPTHLIFPEIKEEENESDAYSEGKSDCESQNNDLDKERYQHISSKIMKFIENFNREVVGDRKKFRLSKKKNLLPLKNSNYKRKINDSMKLVPSLKYKMQKNEQSEQKISEEKDQSMIKGNRISLHKHRQEK